MSFCCVTMVRRFDALTRVALTFGKQSLRSISIGEDADRGRTFWYSGKALRPASVSDSHLMKRVTVRLHAPIQHSNILTYWHSSRRSWRFAMSRLARCRKSSRAITSGACTRTRLCSTHIRVTRRVLFRRVRTARVALCMGTNLILPQHTGTMDARRCQARTDSLLCRRTLVSHRHHTDGRQDGRRSSSCQMIAC